MTFTHAARYEQVKGAVLPACVLHTLGARVLRTHAHTEGPEPSTTFASLLAGHKRRLPHALKSAVFAGASFKGG